MSLLDKASLIVTPNAYKESKLYSVVPSSGAGDMNVVRATTATRVNSAGLIEVVPRNLVEYSEQFDNAYWTKDGSTISANATTAPNGNLTADKLNETATTGVHRVGRATFPAGTQRTFSVFAKKSERNFVSLFENNSVGNTVKGVIFNLNTGVVSLNNDAAYYFNPTIQDFGNGWYRCSVNWTPISLSVPSIGSSLDGLTNSYVGVSGNGIFIYGAQLEDFATATEYFPTTTRLNIPRIDYTNGSCPSLLVEPQRTNIALNTDGNLSTYFNVNVTNASSSFNSFVNAIQFPSTGLAIAYKSTVTTAQVYAISVFIKMDDNSVPILSASSTTGNMSLVIGGAVVTNNLKVESYGNNVYRLSGTATSAGLNINNGVIRYDTQVLKSFKITGIQLEAGSYPTSYIPTVASTVTRNADVISKTGISSLIGQTEGTIFCDVTLNSRVNFTYFAIANNLASTENYLGIAFLNNAIAFESVVATVLQANISHSNTSTGRFKIAAAYKANDFILYINGTQIGTDTSGTIPACSQLGLNAYNQSQALNYNSVQLYKTRLTNTELAQLTTL